MSADPITVARENVDAFNAGDWKRFRATLADDGVYSEPSTQRRASGADAAIELSKGWRHSFPDAHGTVTNAIASGDHVSLEITWEGTQTGEMVGPGMTVPPSGRRVVVQAVEVFHVVDGRIAEARHYFDLMSLLVQMGAMPAPASAG
jgi:steroid delta-isomerase-like uncharacterized protein